MRWTHRGIKLSGMEPKELEERVDEILLKKTRGEKLTEQEQVILASSNEVMRSGGAVFCVALSTRRDGFLEGSRTTAVYTSEH